MASNATMDKPDADLLQSMFAENASLRQQTHLLSRELFAKTLLIDQVEEELRSLQTQRDADARNAKNAASKRIGGGGLGMGAGGGGGGGAGGGGGSGPSNKELEEAMYTIDRKNNEIRQLKEEVKQLQIDLEAQELSTDKVETDLNDLRGEFETFRIARNNDRMLAATSDGGGGGTGKQGGTEEKLVAKQLSQLREQLTDAESTMDRQKKQIQELTTEAARKYAAQQTQLQGLESLLEQVKQQYDEFIAVTKLENDTARDSQAAEYDKLRASFDAHKKEQYDEKRTMMVEHHAMMFTVQSLFDEYKKTCEFLFHTESAKLEDELINQTMRYENEILYLIQAKDKFYSDMMVSKDAKIMNLIEGSDLTSLLQKHEMDIEAVRKEYTLELERIKTQQESEQKHVISLLQRQNGTLESKAEKLAQHIKALESKIKDLISAIEAKNRAIADRDDARAELEQRHSVELERERLKMAQVMQEKEFLRHKVIRLNMESKGTGENTVENMLKRVARETADMARSYSDMEHAYDMADSARTKLERQVKDRDRWIEFLEREVAKRTDEFRLMTTTFESFLAQRAKQARIDRNRRFGKRLGSEFSGSTSSDAPGPGQSGAAASTTREDGGDGRSDSPTRLGDGRALGLDLTIAPRSTKTVRIRVPDVVTRVRANELESMTAEKQEMERAASYLKRFKTMSRAFATGELQLRKLAPELALSSTLASVEDDIGGALGPVMSHDEGAEGASVPAGLVPLYSESKHFMASRDSMAASGIGGGSGRVYGAPRSIAERETPEEAVSNAAALGGGGGGGTGSMPSMRRSSMATSSSVAGMNPARSDLHMYDYEAGNARARASAAALESSVGSHAAMIGAFKGSKVAIMLFWSMR
ncbi:hypothetical protein BC828DRAFT_374923 [Blastocladiella britannica]|nr:hypothetical protein BC828DRAFT_374923 [Blastocladiella britannica]